MSETEILPAPIINQPPKQLRKFQREKAAFQRLLPQLLQDYRKKYVAIHEERVVASGDELIPVAMAAYEQFGYQPIYVDLVTDEPLSPVRLPHYTILSPG